MSDAKAISRSTRLARWFWPVALVLLAWPLLAESLIGDRYSTSPWLFAPVVIVPMLLAARSSPSCAASTPGPRWGY